MSAPKKLVIYHKSCMDGFSAAWVAKKKFGDKAQFFPAVHQTPFPKDVKGKEVYMIDFCYPENIMEKIKKEAARVIVIDHHISQKEAVKISDERLFDIKHSGAVLAWKYFYPGKKVPKLLLYVEDTDIWKFTMPKSKELFASLETVKFDFKAWSRLASEFETSEGRKKYLEKGKAILDFIGRSIDNIVANAEPVRFEGHKAYVVNSPLLISDVGHVLAEKAGGVGIVWVKKGNKLKISLRSNGRVDVSKIALKYGGGGHKAAASFSVSLEKGMVKFPWKATSVDK
ncbi:MAG: DHHA1 domain-containing protein [Candidatus Colwellbacteria bacterium]|nr:DHHA1 domain-containing protein [Candidatus Colwellbacteria bacterium]